MSQLEYENHQVLTFLQASIGCISCNMRVVSLLPVGESAVLRFLLEQDSAEDREEIEDLLSEYCALRANGEEDGVESEVAVIGQRELTRKDVEGRVIYIRKVN